MMTTTTDLLTFFQPGEAEGTTWTFSTPAGCEWREVWAYVAGEAELSRFTSELLPEDFSQLRAEIGSAIRKHGGILIEAAAHNDVIRLKVSGESGGGYRLPGSVLRLKVYGDSCFERITDSIDLEAGDHLIVPASAPAEQKLAAFRETLKGLPTDLESSIFNVLRRPSLEWRINRIERILSQSPATQAEGQRRQIQQEPLGQKVRRFFMWPIPAGYVAAGLLLLTGAFAGYNSLFGSAPEAAEAAPAATPPAAPPPAEQPSAGSGGNGPTAPVEVEAKVPSPLEELFKTLAASENEALKTLYEKHLRKTEGQIPGWGLAKLEALHLGIMNPGDPALSDPQAWTAVKEIYRGERGKAALESKKEASALLAWTSCAYFGKPELPATQKNDTNPPLVFGTESDCRKLNLEDIRVGYQDLTDWVKAQPK